MIKGKLYPHQKEARKKVHLREYGALLMDMGTGKTVVVIDELVDLFRDGRACAAVILAPKAMYTQWLSELKKFLPDDVAAQTDLFLWTGSKKTKKATEDVRAILYPEPKRLKIAVVNTEACSTMNGEKFLTVFTRSHNLVYMVVDECTDIKNHKARRTKVVTKAGGNARFRRILSGSLGYNSPLEYFAPFRFLHNGIFGGSYWSFRAQYAILADQFMGGGRSVKVVTGYKNREQLRKTVDLHSYRILLEEAVDMPRKLYKTVAVTMGKEQAKHYKDMSENFMIRFDDGEVSTAQAVISQLLRLRQILSGHVVKDNPNGGYPVVETIPDATRVASLMTALEGVHGKVVIWATYKQAVRDIIAALQAEYGEDCAIEYTGDNSDREEDLQEWRTNSLCRFFVGTNCGSRGLNLTEARYMFRYNPEWDLDAVAQSEKRIHRIGQKETCVYVDLVCPGTIDTHIINLLNTKKANVNAVSGKDELRKSDNLETLKAIATNDTAYLQDFAVQDAKSFFAADCEGAE